MVRSNRLSRLAVRGAKYALVGSSALALDLLILFTLLEYTELSYQLLVAFSFLIAVSISYFISYHWVFSGTTQKLGRGYVYFITLALSGAAGITILVHLSVELLSASLLVARVSASALIGTLNFLVNTIYNFKLW